VWRAFVEEVFQGKRDHGVGDVGVEGSDITNAMIVLGRGGMGRDQMISKKWWVSFM